MEEDSYPLVSNGVVSSIKFSLASFDEICKYSINNCPVSHPSQLGNPFLGLPLESGRCESCGTAETEKCEGHFGYVELPIPIYHPSHISELKNILTMLCLKCMRVKRGKIKCDTGKEKISIASCTYCRAIAPISVNEVKKTDGTVCLELRVSSRIRLREGFWNFLDKFGFHHGEAPIQSLHPLESVSSDNEFHFIFNCHLCLAWMSGRHPLVVLLPEDLIHLALSVHQENLRRRLHGDLDLDQPGSIREAKTYC